MNVVQETVADFANFHRFIYLVIVGIFFDEICAFLVTFLIVSRSMENDPIYYGVQ